MHPIQSSSALTLSVALLAASLATSAIPGCAMDGEAPPPAASVQGPVLTLSPDEILTADQLKPGMTGYGLTVFAGARPERFNVEIISVLRNYDPQADMILIRCSGHGLEKTGIAAGMSGSPIYIDGKLIGALAYGWSFTTEPIAGVQPIAQMLRNSGMRTELPPADQEQLPPPGEEQAAASGGGAAFPVSARPDKGAAHRMARSADPIDATRLRPLATPLMVSGSSKAAMERLCKRLDGSGLVPISSGGTGGQDPRIADARLEPGGTVSIPILSGDMDMCAIGTVTAVIGDRVLAFGHPMFGEGPVNLPMGVGVIHTFIPSLDSSFKLGSAGPVQGAIRRDESFSILGVRGPKPFMTPMTVTVTSWDGSPTKTYRYEVVDEWYFASSAAEFAILSSATADHGTPRDLTAHYSGRIQFKGFEPYTFSGVDDLSDNSGWFGPSWDVGDRIYSPISAMLNNPWGKALVESIQVDIRLVNERAACYLERARLEKSVLLPGEPAVIHLTFERYRKPKLHKTIQVELPADLPDGTYSLGLADAEDYRYLMEDHNPRQFMPENMTELVAAFDRMAKPRDDRYYAVLTLPRGGLTTRDSRLPALPPSRALILQQANRFDMMPFTEDKVTPIDMGMVVSGSRDFQITIDRERDKRR